ncbi:AraC family transcriptional regulator [Pseudonocardia acaciae]|uniref:AraC family transcriptional regulator n=1 Tax=Pseudonocardia acaciae TaxID=551276 RepID=UPI0006845A93|nr:AraC family transcriptional regulator [Pseudonocardia acaciae]
MDAVWSYWRPGSADVVELCAVRGTSAALPAHFHDEDQLTFVLSGCRRFLLRGAPVEVRAGHGLLIPAGVPHRSLPDSSEVVSFNAYLPEGRYTAPGVVRELRTLWRRGRHVSWGDVIGVIGDHRKPAGDVSSSRPAGVPPGRPVNVRQLAAAAGMSREGYSRRFLRRHGMSPHAYLLARRLNEARGLLRAGAPIASAAADCGFADQSHFGRWFRRAFGTTPGRYRQG